MGAVAKQARVLAPLAEPVVAGVAKALAQALEPVRRSGCRWRRRRSDASGSEHGFVLTGDYIADANSTFSYPNDWSYLAWNRASWYNSSYQAR